MIEGGIVHIKDGDWIGRIISVVDGDALIMELGGGRWTITSKIGDKK